MCAYDRTEIARQITLAALGNIQKYTDSEDYELILVDNDPIAKELYQKYQCIRADKHIVIADIGYSASMNLGAKESNSEFEYICFIHNDVFVWEGWLPKLIEELDRKQIDVIVPSQGHLTREQIKDSYKNLDTRLDNDAGIMLMKKETFANVGGWDDRFGSVYHDGAYRKKIMQKGYILAPTSQVVITHLGWITLGQDQDKFEKLRTEEGSIYDNLIYK